jgi:hypothetical protein
MSRRTYTIPLRCAESGCRESSVCEAIGRDEYAEARDRYARNPWRCSRHRNPERVLSPDNLERTAVCISGKSKRYPDLDSRFWETPEYDGCGVIDGPGFKAFANDFPPGTRLIVTARIELPEENPHA